MLVLDKNKTENSFSMLIVLSSVIYSDPILPIGLRSNLYLMNLVNVLFSQFLA